MGIAKNLAFGCYLPYHFFNWAVVPGLTNHEYQCCALAVIKQHITGFKIIKLYI